MNDVTPEALKDALAHEDASRLAQILDEIEAVESPRLFSRLDAEEQRTLLEKLPPQRMVDLVEELPDALIVEMMRNAAPERAAKILDRLPSDDQVDLLAQLEEAESAAILASMAPAEVADVELLSVYPPDTAGGLMSTEFLAFPQSAHVSEVIHDLRAHAASYARYHIQYIYVVDSDGRLVGVVQPRNLLFRAEDETLASPATRKAITLGTHAELPEMQAFFDRHNFLAAPVVDEEGKLLGIVTRLALEEAAAKEAEHSLMRFAGIISGEEFRTMPVATRLSRRLAWLSVTILLNLVAASVVGMFEETLSAVISLAVFLPVISGISGSSGNQAIAVSMRELTLGLLQSREYGWVIGKEATVAAINGIALGAVLAAAAYLWKGNIYLGLVVGSAQAISVVVAACMGGVLPLVLKRMEIDPALAAAPILTTVSDALAFFLTLSFAALMMQWLI